MLDLSLKDAVESDATIHEEVSKPRIATRDFGLKNSEGLLSFDSDCMFLQCCDSTVFDCSNSCENYCTGPLQSHYVPPTSSSSKHIAFAPQITYFRDYKN